MAVSSGTATVTLPTDEQILITREFDAPKHLVYEAWTTPELVKRWWTAKHQSPRRSGALRPATPRGSPGRSSGVAPERPCQPERVEDLLRLLP
jgi:uncharacterized protein YndB with AHSA1/START domain